MKLTRNIREWIAAALLVVGVGVFISSLSDSQAPGDTSRAARRVERLLERRVASLDGYIEKALAQDPETWLSLEGMPRDFVVYRYCKDTLQSWCHEFPITNDRIDRRVFVPFVADPRIPAESPLLQVSDSLTYCNLGARWYLAKWAGDANLRVIAGVEVLNESLTARNSRANRLLRLPARFSIRPLSVSGGTAVVVGGRPQFKIVQETVVGAGRDASPLLWVSLAGILIAFLIFLSAGRTRRRFACVVVGAIVLLAGLYFWGRFSRNRVLIFSPMLYAGGDVLYSLGAVILINLTVLMCAGCAYMVRKNVWRWMNTRARRIVILLGVLVLAVGVIVYSQAALRSIALNSGFSLEIYKLGQLSPFCAIVYASFITLLLSVPLLLQVAAPALSRPGGKPYDAFSLSGRVLYALLMAVYLVVTAGVLGFRKEQDRMGLLATRLSFDRDIALELRLRRMEPQIADDKILSTLSQFAGTEQSIQSRIFDYYFSGSERDYLVSTRVYNEFNNTREAAQEFNAAVQDGVPISDNSRFLYARHENGRPYYVGVFLYLTEKGTVTRVLVRLEQRENRGGRGYAGILGLSPPGQVTLPSGYSYARYSGRVLKAYRGSYPYPTEMDDPLYAMMYNAQSGHLRQDGYTHFLYVVGNREGVVISRSSVGTLSYIMAGILVALISFLILSLAVLARPKKQVFQQSYYKSRISWVLLTSLLLTLLAMSLVSVLFVYSRNTSNRQSVMSDKISSIVAMMNTGLQGVPTASEVNWQSMRILIERVGGETASDITLYTPSGRLLMTTTPLFFEQLMVAERMDGTAYYNITFRNRRHYIQQERLGTQKFYSMYAPLFADDGSMVAILCSPYNEETYDFEEDAVMHSLTILSLFLLFLLMSLFMVSRIVDRMFKPLSEMSSKMSSADLGSLEYINYDRDDEVSSIVQAYNRMVTELSESSRKLAQAERDKAWSGMARQVAHEIKNPLTPMKLQLQRVIRLKQKGDPAWQTRFEEASQVILDHIDILTDTANEFSTFAKLYTEEPTDIALDKLLREEISMFDNKDNITFDYLGLDGVMVRGPKPQITRVFVNLLGNAVQAIGEAPDGHIVVSLRKSSQDGFYDIVVEDNGPGVSEEHIERLFTPNFTTKNGGSGLGLAISRSILERCGSTISYSRSFGLGGACFTIRYPIC
ncbi:MAG: HAMP domain-containing histidine kinase [Bacteroidales bacterium]|nr:HAMP domain-containing histidine kinase [Bacteroidales bacterium]